MKEQSIEINLKAGKISGFVTMENFFQSIIIESESLQRRKPVSMRSFLREGRGRVVNFFIFFIKRVCS